MTNARVIATGLEFPEGPVAMPDGSIVVVEIRGRRLTRVFPDGREEPIRGVDFVGTPLSALDSVLAMGATPVVDRFNKKLQSASHSLAFVGVAPGKGKCRPDMIGLARHCSRRKNSQKHRHHPATAVSANVLQRPHPIQLVGQPYAPRTGGPPR